MDDPFNEPLEFIPANVDLRELGLVTPPKNISFNGCGSGAAAVASLAESNILRAWSYFENNSFIERYYLDNEDAKSSDIEISVQYIMNNSRTRDANRGFYCTLPAEHAINDMAALDTIQFDISPIMKYSESTRKFNPEPLNVIPIIPDETRDDIISKASEYVEPLFSDANGNSLILLYHTPFFSLSGNEGFDKDMAAIMKQYLARGISLISQIHLGSDREYETFKNYNSSDTFSAECIHVSSKYQPPSYETMKKQSVDDGYNKYEERMLYINIVGYGIKNGEEVWIVKAPFGKDFGNLGYLYFPILNNTLCMEELVLTALPNHIPLDELNTLFTEEQAAEMGLNELYSIENLIQQRLNEKSQNIASTDEYAGEDSFATNVQVISRHANADEYISITSSQIECQLNEVKSNTDYSQEFTILQQNCTAKIFAQTNETQDLASYEAECILNANANLTVEFDETERKWLINNTPSPRFKCFVENLTDFNDGAEIKNFEVFVDVQEIGSLFDVSQPNLAAWPVVRCYYYTGKNVTEDDKKLLPKQLVYVRNISAEAQERYTPGRIKMLGIRPGVIRCDSSKCVRFVYDKIRGISEIWDCVYSKDEDSNHYMSCKPKDLEQREGILYYGEIRQNVTSCMNLITSTDRDFSFCSINYNMNFTSVRVRVNKTVKQDADMERTGQYKLRGILRPIMYRNTRPDFISKDYLWLINITFPEIEARTVIDIVYPDEVIRPTEAECKVQTNEGTFEEPGNSGTTNNFNFQVECRRFEGTTEVNSVYVCQNLLWKCRAELYGWNKSPELAYFLNFSGSFPLILRGATEMANTLNKTLYTWIFEYADVQYDYMTVASNKKDVYNFAFDPCKVADDVNSDVCRDVLISNMQLVCGVKGCTPLYQTSKEMYEFLFSNDVVHSYYNNTNKPEIKTTSQFFCDFLNLSCIIDRRDFNKPGILCDSGLVMCNGVSKTTQTFYSVTGAAVSTETGTSVFVFNTTDFQCAVNQIKTFKAVKAADDISPEREFVWGDAVCIIRNSQTSYSTSSSSPDYLIKDSNSVDDVSGLLPMEKSNVGLQLFFSAGLLIVVSVVIAISAIFSGLPGSTKTCCTKAWNHIVCCEDKKFYCTSYDKYGIPLIDHDEEEKSPANYGAETSKNVISTVREGFRGLSYFNLLSALKIQEKKVVRSLKTPVHEEPLTQLQIDFANISHSERISTELPANAVSEKSQ